MMLSILLVLLLQAAAPPSRTATVRGKVVADDTGAPVKYASVQLRRSGVGQETVTITADSWGVFEFRNVEPGTYYATADKPGYVLARYKTGPDESEQIKLSAGQVQEDVNFRLPRAAVIAGKVIDTYGEPVVDANVQVMVKVYRQGRVELAVRKNTQTDDHGEYRLHDLPAGRYYVQASSTGRGGFGGPPLGVTIFPSASRLEDAQAIIVKAGDEHEGINLTLQDAVVFNVAGKLVDFESGQPMGNFFLNLIPQNFGAGGISTNGQTRPDGSFRLNGVAPGHYRLSGNAMMAGDTPKVNMNFTRPLDIGAANVSDLVIKIGPGATVKGVAKAEGGALPGELQMNLTSHSASGATINFASAMVAADGSFEITKVQPGSYEVALNVMTPPGGEPPPRFFLRSASAGDLDVTDGGLEVGESGSIGLSVTVDLRPATLSGKALGADDKPVSNMSVALISADPRKRLLTRYFRRAQTSRDGAFKMIGVTPGDYLLILWPGDDAGQVLDPDAFQMIEKFATRVTLERGGVVTQDLRLTPELRTLAEAFSQ
jgi:hypothetical protein